MIVDIVIFLLFLLSGCSEVVLLMIVDIVIFLLVLLLVFLIRIVFIFIICWWSWCHHGMVRRVRISCRRLWCHHGMPVHLRGGSLLLHVVNLLLRLLFRYFILLTHL